MPDIGLNPGFFTQSLAALGQSSAPTTWKYDPKKSQQENLEDRINFEKIARARRGQNPEELSPEWLANTKEDISQTAMSLQSDRFLDPNSDYYKTIGKQIRSQLTGAMSPNSLLAQMVAAGGSPSQAREQIKAMEGRINESAGNLTNQYYLNASGQGTSLLSTLAQMAQQGSQFQTNLRNQNDLYDKQKQDSLINTLLSGGLSAAGTMAGGGFGAPGGSPKMSNPYNDTTIKSINPYYRMK